MHFYTIYTTKPSAPEHDTKIFDFSLQIFSYIQFQNKISYIELAVRNINIYIFYVEFISFLLSWRKTYLL